MKLLINELVKIKHAKSIRILFGVFLAFILLSTAISNHGSDLMHSGFAGPFMWSGIMGAAGLFAYGALAAWMIAEEFQLGVVRNAIGCGVGKRRYFAVKVAGVLGISTILHLLCTCIFTAALTFVYGFDPAGILYSDYWHKVLVFNAVALAVQLSCVAFYICLAYLFQTASFTFAASILITVLDTLAGSRAIKSGRRLATPYGILFRLSRHFTEDTILTRDFALLALPCLCLLGGSLLISYILFMKRGV